MTKGIFIYQFNIIVNFKLINLKIIIYIHGSRWGPGPPKYATTGHTLIYLLFIYKKDQIHHRKNST